MEKLIELEKKLEEEKFWGKTTVTWKNGIPVHVIEEKSHKLE